MPEREPADSPRLEAAAEPVAAGGWLSTLLAGRAEAHVPQARLTPLVALKFLSEEILHSSAMFVSRRRLDAPHVRERFAAEVPGIGAYFRDRGFVDDPMSFHREPPPLHNVNLRWVTRNGVEFEHMRFDSGYEPREGEPGRERWLAYEPNRTAHAWVMRHKRVRRPWLVCVNGFRTGFATIDLAAFRMEELHRQGLNIACYVLPLHGPRRVARWSGDRFFRAGYINTVHGITQAVWDLRRLLAWVRGQECERVGLYGLSLGGYTAATMSAFDDDLACVIAGIPVSDFVRLMRGIAPDGLVEHARAMGMDWDTVEQVLRVISPLTLAPKVPRNRRYIFGGLVDRIVDPTHVRDLWLHWDKPRIAWYHGNHLSFNGEPEVRTLLREAMQDACLAGPGI